jgi:hypothetical protein
MFSRITTISLALDSIINSNYAGQAQAGPSYSPRTSRRCSSRISSAMSVLDSRTSSANGGVRPTDSAGQRRDEAVHRGGVLNCQPSHLPVKGIWPRAELRH